MVQAMESWFLADVDALEGYYGQGFGGSRFRRIRMWRKFLSRTLKEGLSGRLGIRGKRVIVREDSFEILGRLDPVKVREASEHADTFVKALL